MEVEKAILERRSVRTFTDRPVDKKILEKLCTAAMEENKSLT